MVEPREGEGLWARCDVLPDGSYGVVVTFGADHAWSLDTGQVVGYAATRSRPRPSTTPRCSPCSPPWASRSTMRRCCCGDLRDQRAYVQAAVVPLRFNAAISLASREPFIQLELDGTAVGHISPGDLREHASGALSALAAAELDTNLYRALTAGTGLDLDHARAVISDLANHWPGRPRTEAPA